MVVFFNTFLSYLILVIISAGVIVLGIVCGKKLREAKDAKEAKEASADETAKEQ